MSKRDYYDVLEVNRNASDGEIKSAYRKLALKYHPDRNPGNAAAEESFKEAAEAYAVLGDTDKRATYDRFGHSGLGKGFGAASQADEPEEDIFATYSRPRPRGTRADGFRHLSEEEFASILEPIEDANGIVDEASFVKIVTVLKLQGMKPPYTTYNTYLKRHDQAQAGERYYSEPRRHNEQRYESSTHYYRYSYSYRGSDDQPKTATKQPEKEPTYSRTDAAFETILGGGISAVFAQWAWNADSIAGQAFLGWVAYRAGRYAIRNINLTTHGLHDVFRAASHATSAVAMGGLTSLFANMAYNTNSAAGKLLLGYLTLQTGVRTVSQFFQSLNAAFK